MSFYNSLLLFFNKIIELRKRYVQIPFTKRNLIFTFLLYNENYIDSFYCKNGFIFIVFRVFDGTFSIKKMSKIARKGQFKNSKVSMIWKSSFSAFGSILLNTSSGILSEYSAKKLRKGGHLICFITSLCCKNL